MRFHWTKHALARLAQRGATIGREDATAEILDAFEGGRTSTEQPFLLGNEHERQGSHYAWSIDGNRIYALVQEGELVTVLTVLQPTLKGRREQLRRSRRTVLVRSFEGATADRPQDLPVPPNADKRYEELDGG